MSPMGFWVWNQGEPGPEEPHTGQFYVNSYLYGLARVYMTRYVRACVVEGRTCYLARNPLNPGEYLRQSGQNAYAAGFEQERQDEAEAVWANRDEDARRSGRIHG